MTELSYNKEPYPSIHDQAESVDLTLGYREKAALLRDDTHRTLNRMLISGILGAVTSPKAWPLWMLGISKALGVFAPEAAHAMPHSESNAVNLSDHSTLALEIGSLPFESGWGMTSEITGALNQQLSGADFITERVMLQVGESLAAEGIEIAPETMSATTFTHDMTVLRSGEDGRPEVEKLMGENATIVYGMDQGGQYHAIFDLSPDGTATGIKLDSENNQLVLLDVYRGEVGTSFENMIGYYDKDKNFIPLVDYSDPNNTKVSVPKGEGASFSSVSGGKPMYMPINEFQRLSEKIVTYDANTWDTMDQTARDAVLAKLPETNSDGYTRGGFSEADDSLVKYYANGKLASLYDITSGKYLTPEAANVAELDLTDTTKWDMAAFWPEQFDGNIEVMNEDGTVKTLSPELQMINELLKHFIDDNVDWGNTEFKLMSEDTSGNLNFIARLKKIPNLKFVGGMVFPSEPGIDSNKQFKIGFKSLNYEGREVTIINYYVNDNESRAAMVGVSVNDFKALISQADMPLAGN